MLGPERLDVLGPEPLVDRAVAPPQQERRLLALPLGEAAEVAPRIPDPHVVEPVAHGDARVAAEVLVGEEQHLVALAGAAAPGPPPSAHSSTARALVEVHTAPPWRPTKALMAAELFM